MFYGFLYDLGLLVDSLYVEHKILDVGVVAKGLFKQSNSFKVSHSIYKGRAF